MNSAHDVTSMSPPQKQQLLGMGLCLLAALGFSGVSIFGKLGMAAGLEPLILDGVGATLPRRDACDLRLIREVKERKGRIIDHPKQVGGWPALKSVTPPPDADGDGMPDAWEKAHWLNPGDAADGNGDADGDGYTNVEEYLNGTPPREAAP